MNFVKCTIKNSKGQLRYTIQGKYTKELTCTDHISDESWTVFEAPLSKKPTNAAKMFGMNIYSMQLNVLSEELRKLVPPSDTRFRDDIRYWEQADLDKATFHKGRLEENQRNRRA